VPLSLAEKLVEWIPEADLIVLEGCGHYPQHEAPERLHDALANFLN
jgi:pimeloyl-ACP methyl ester carboxylesterase